MGMVSVVLSLVPSRAELQQSMQGSEGEQETNEKRLIEKKIKISAAGLKAKFYFLLSDVL